jgi:alkaline phosphatase D
MNSAADFAARRDAAYQAYYEHMPLRASAFARALAGGEAGAELRLYAHLRFGTLADLLLLDTRQYRDRQVCGPRNRPSGMVDPARCAEWEDPGRSLLGTQQERWLDQALARGGPGWTVIGQQTLFGRRDNLPGPGENLWNDGWDGYPAARTRFTDALQKHRIRSPVLLGGDVHENWVGHLKADYRRPDSASLGVEFCGTSITSRARNAAKVPERLAENPHFIFAEGRYRGYGVTEFTPDRLSTQLRVLDDATRPNARIQTLASFNVQAGRPLLEQH